MKVFVINLDSSTERLSKCKEQLDKQSIKFERVSAVLGVSLTQTEIDMFYSPELNQRYYYQSLTKGEIGCFMSHRKVWQQMIAQSIPYAFILEDDFVIQSNINNVIQDIKSLDFDWHYIKLSSYGKQRQVVAKLPLINHSLVRFGKQPAGTCAQVVSLAGARRLLKSTEKIGLPIDVALQHWWEIDVDILGLQPFPFIPNALEASDICRVSDRSQVKRYRLRRVRQQIQHRLQNFFKTKQVLKNCHIKSKD